MYILKNAITSIFRNKGRNILIGIIIIVISCSAAITLAITNSANKIIKSYKDKTDVVATISMNREKMMENFDSNDRSGSKSTMKKNFNNISLTVSDIEKYGKSKFVESYYYTVTTSVDANIDKVESDDSDKGPQRENRGNQDSGDFSLVGYSSIDSLEDFISGKYKISSGSVFEDFDGNECLINKELATFNDLKVGDKIKVKVDDNTYELKISGIFEESSSDDKEFSMFAGSANTIITNNKFVNNIVDKNDLNVRVNPSFNLKDGVEVDDFSKDLKSMGLSDYLEVSSNLDEVEEQTKAISNISTFAITFLVITLIIGIVVLLIINMINLRERKYEIGVLRTIGMSKIKVLSQFMCELLIIALVSLCIGAGVGAATSVPVANYLLENEIKTSEENTSKLNENFGGPNKNFGKKMNKGSIEQVDSIKAVVDVKVLGELLVIGIVITMISGTSALISIQRFSPLDILKERS